MNNEINQSNNLMNQINIDNHKKENGSINNIKYKFKKVKTSSISNNNIYEISSQRKKIKKCVTKNFLKNSLKTKYSNVNKKGKIERIINKKNTINSINENSENEQSINKFGGSISPKKIRKMKIDENENKDKDKESNIITLFKMTDNLYANDEHFQKDLIKKDKIKNKNHSSNIVKNNKNIMSGRINSTYQKKKLIITFGLNEDNKNNLKNSYAENSETNLNFKRNVSTINKGVDSEFIKTKEKSNFSYYLKLKQKCGSPSKENNEETNYNHNNNNINNTNQKNENHKMNVLHNCHTNKEKNYTKKNKQVFREKTNKTVKNVESQKKIKEEEKVKEETNIRSKKSNNNILKENSKKTNNSKSHNKTQIPDDDVEIPKKKNQKKQNNLKTKFCFLCCLTNKLNDSDEL